MYYCNEFKVVIIIVSQLVRLTSLSAHVTAASYKQDVLLRIACDNDVPTRTAPRRPPLTSDWHCHSATRLTILRVTATLV